VKIALAAAHFQSVGVALAWPRDTVDKAGVERLCQLLKWGTEALSCALTLPKHTPMATKRLFKSLPDTSVKWGKRNCVLWGMRHTPDAAINVRVVVIPREGESQALKNTPLLQREAVRGAHKGSDDDSHGGARGAFWQRHSLGPNDRRGDPVPEHPLPQEPTRCSSSGSVTGCQTS
jgi:hypothetical protein